MNFVTGLPISMDWKRNSYNVIFVIVDRFIKIIYYKLIKTTIDVDGLAKAIIDMVVKQYSVLMSIIGDIGSLFTSKF